jgi:hypothetical protein
VTTARLLEDGAPLSVEGLEERIGDGPWARWLATAAVPDEGTHRAERGRRLARAGAVSDVTVAEGSITARVTGSTGNEYKVSLVAAPIRPSAWDAAGRAIRGRGSLQAAAAGDAQSVQLAHLLETRFGARLAPSARELRRSCTCPDDEPLGACKHVAALAFAVADAIDRDPSVFLVWRGCEPVDPAPADPWQAAALPEARPLRALPTAAVLRRLGRSGIRAGGVDLADALERAYEAFAATRPDRA